MFISNEVYKPSIIKKVLSFTTSCSNEEASHTFLLIITESSITLTYLHKDINTNSNNNNNSNNYTQSVLCYESFPFIIYDALITSTNMFLLLTSCGLLLLSHPLTTQQHTFTIEATEIFNTNASARDQIMNLHTNSTKTLFIAYSNTNIFFIYTYNTNTRSFTLLNKQTYLTDYFITSIDIDNNNNNNSTSSNVSFYSKHGPKYSTTTLTYNATLNEYIYNNELTLMYMNAISSQLTSQTYNSIDIFFTNTRKFIFIITDKSICIMKVNTTNNNANSSSSSSEISLTLENEIPYKDKDELFIKYEYIYNSNSNSYYYLLEFDNNIRLFKTNKSETYIKKCSFNKNNNNNNDNSNSKKLFKGKSSVLLNENEVMFYNAFGNFEIGVINENNYVYDIELGNVDRNMFRNKILCYDASYVKHNELIAAIASQSIKSSEAKIVKVVNGYNENVIKSIEHNGRFTFMKVVCVCNGVVVVVLSGLKGSVVYVWKIRDIHVHMNKVKEYTDEVVNVYKHGVDCGSVVVVVFKKKVIVLWVDNEGNVVNENELVSYWEDNVDKHIIMSDMCVMNNNNNNNNDDDLVMSSTNYMCYIVLFNSLYNVTVVECCVTRNDNNNNNITYNCNVIECQSKFTYEISCLHCCISNNDINILCGLYDETKPLMSMHYNISSKTFTMNNNINTSALLTSSPIHQVISHNNTYILISYRNGMLQLLNDHLQQLSLYQITPSYEYPQYPFNISNITHTDTTLSFTAYSCLYSYNITITTSNNAYLFMKYYYNINTSSSQSPHSTTLNSFNILPNALFNNTSLCLYLTNNNITLSSLLCNEPFNTYNIIHLPLFAFPRNETCTHITTIPSSSTDNQSTVLCLTKQAHHIKLYLFTYTFNTLHLQNTFNINSFSNPKVTCFTILSIPFQRKLSFHIEQYKVIALLINNENKGSILQLFTLNNITHSLISIGSITLPVCAYSICVVKDVFVIGAVDYLFFVLFEFDVDNETIKIKQGGQQQQFPNTTLCIKCVSYDNREIVVGDNIEGISYVKLKEMKNGLYVVEMLGKDEYTRRLKGFNVVDDNDSANEMKVIICESDGLVSLVKLNDTEFNEVDCVDVKECVVCCDKIKGDVAVSIGLLGGVMMFKVVKCEDEEYKRKVKELYVEACTALTNYYFSNSNNAITYKDMLNINSNSNNGRRNNGMNIHVELIEKALPYLNEEWVKFYMDNLKDDNLFYLNTN